MKSLDYKAFFFLVGSIKVTTSVEVVEMLGDFRGIYFRRHKVGTWGKEYERVEPPPLIFSRSSKVEKII